MVDLKCKPLARIFILNFENQIRIGGDISNLDQTVMWTFFEHAFQIGCFIELKADIIMMSLVSCDGQLLGP